MGGTRQVIPMSSKTSPSSLRVPVRIGTALSTRFRRLTVTGIRAAAFWAAVFLPVAYIPAAYGVAGLDGGWTLPALLAIHVVCMVIGHEYNHPSESAATVEGSRS